MHNQAIEPSTIYVAPPIATCVRLDATNGRGKRIGVKVTCTQLSNVSGEEPRGVILVMEEAANDT